MPETTKTDSLLSSEAKAISVSTGVQLGLVITICAGLWTGARWTAKFDRSIELLELKLEQVRVDIRERTGDRFTRSEATQVYGALQQWADLLGARNPELVEVPFPPFPTSPRNPQ